MDSERICESSNYAVSSRFGLTTLLVISSKDEYSSKGSEIEASAFSSDFGSTRGSCTRTALDSEGNSLPFWL